MAVQTGSTVTMAKWVTGLWKKARPPPFPRVQEGVRQAPMKEVTSVYWRDFDKH